MATGIKRIVLVAGLALALLGSLGGMLRPHEAEAVNITYYYLPDLVITSTNVYSNFDGNPGVTFTIKNQGAVDAGTFSVFIYAANGTFLKAVRIYGLASGASITKGVTVSDWSGIWCTSAYQLRADAAREVNERDETNNTASACMVK